MQRIHSFFHFKEATLHYSKYGNGNKVILLFHGFGLNHEIFYPIEEKLKEEYTIYNFDIFFHGKSQWNYIEKPIDSDFWKAMMDAFLVEQNIKQFSLLGFSIGARFVWTTLILFPDKIKRLILIAPDGIKTSIWYKISVYTYLSRAIFKQLVTNPKYFRFLVKLINFFGFAPKETVRFASSQLLTKEQRDRVYFTWVTYRKLMYSNNKITNAINQYEIPFEIYLGKYDRLVSFAMLKSFLSKIKNKKVEIIEAGHSNLITSVSNLFNFQ